MGYLSLVSFFIVVWVVLVIVAVIQFGVLVTLTMGLISLTVGWLVHLA